MKVLLTDDSTTMRKIQRRVLTAMGIEDVTEASNGKEALEKLKEANYDFTFLLLDINMPEMNGMETLKQIRSNPDSAHLPVIMCTSVAEKSQVLDAIKAGASNYVVKPFQPDDLKKKIEQTLSKQK